MIEKTMSFWASCSLIWSWGVVGSFPSTPVFLNKQNVFKGGICALLPACFYCSHSLQSNELGAEGNSSRKHWQANNRQHLLFSWFKANTSITEQILGTALGVLQPTVCISRSWQDCEAAAREVGKFHCAEVENTCYCADGAVGGLRLEKIALSWVHLESVKLCWHKLEGTSAEFSPRDFTGNLGGCGRGVFSGKHLIFHALAFLVSVSPLISWKLCWRILLASALWF